MASVIATVAETLDLRSAILLLDTGGSDTGGHLETVVWHAPGASAAELDAAGAHARTSYDYLARSRVDRGPDDSATRALPPLVASDIDEPARFILLPLLIDRRPIFGALQIEGAARLDELDLMFANAVANQLAVALARHASIEARQARVEAERSQAVEAEERLRGKFDFVRDVTASLGEGILAVDLEGRITLCNRAAEELLGLATEETLGRPVADVLEIRQSDRALIAAADGPLAIAIRRGDVVRSDEHLFATRARRAFPVSYTSAPFQQDGKVQGAVLAFRDIIDVKRAEVEQRFLANVSAAVAASLDHRETLRAVARAAVPVFADVCFIDEVQENGTVERVDVVFADEARKRHFADLVTRIAPRPGWRNPQPGVIESGAPILVAESPRLEDAATDEQDVLRAIGTKSILAVPLCVRDQRLGTLTFVVAESERCYSDSDLALAEEVARRTAIAIDNARLYHAAQRATRDRENLLAVVSHDLKTPLSVIIMSLDSLRLFDDPRHLPKQLDGIRRSTERMNRLIDDLLDTASIEAGSLSVSLLPIAARPIVAEVLEALEPFAARTSLILANDVPADLPAVRADAARLHQVITNLVGNAIKFTPDRGKIRVRASVVGDEVQLSVADTGAGISEEELPHLFDRFWQARRTARLGRGLGLFIVKGIVEAHRGRIWAESKIGVGSTFFVTLPIAREAELTDKDALVGGIAGAERSGHPVRGA